MCVTPSSSSSGRSSALSAAPAPRSVNIERSWVSTTTVPVGRSASPVRRASTPQRSRARAWRRRSAIPTRPAKRTGAPSAPSQAAVLAPEPPGWRSIRDGVSLRATSGPSGWTTRSSMTSPTTRIIGGPPTRPRSRPATAALPRAIAMLTSSERPPVARCRWSSRKGVTALPVTPAARARSRPSASTRSCSAGSICTAGSIGLATRSAAPTPSASACAIASATSSGPSTRQSRSKPPSVR